jgi:5-deoxy-glucuronate isomerase
VQRVYDEERTLDETMTVLDGDTVLVPRGYQAVSAAPGYDHYYLNVMAGPVREWEVKNDPDHEWLLG